jgi:16S rRNA (guanine527-N7)-methyltransferase
VSEIPPALQAVLEDGQRRGAIGPGSIDVAVAQALDFFAGVHPQPGWRCVDLGSGGGLPGLPLALAHPTTTWVLLDAWEARVEALQRAIRALGLGDRVEALHARAEDAGRGRLRRAADVVVARSFATPAVTAECAAPLLRDGGLLAVSVVRGEDRWPDSGVPTLGLTPLATWETAFGTYRLLIRRGPLDDRFPRRPAAQRRSPLF